MFEAYLDEMSFKWYHSIFCFYHPNCVGPTDNGLFRWFLDHGFRYSMIQKMDDSHGKWKHLKPVFKTQKPSLSGMSVNKWRLWAPKANALSHPTGHSLFSFFFFSLFFFFKTFLSFSLLLYLFSFCSSLEKKAHTHWPLTCTAFLLLSFDSVFFLFFSYRSLTHRPTPTQSERSSALIFDHMLKSSTMRSFPSSLLSNLFFDLAGALKLASITMMDLC